jgi:hypothetical protein
MMAIMDFLSDPNPDHRPKSINVFRLDEFIFVLVDKRLRAARYSMKLTISGRLKGLPIRKILMCYERNTI